MRGLELGTYSVVAPPLAASGAFDLSAAGARDTELSQAEVEVTPRGAHIVLAPPAATPGED